MVFTITFLKKQISYLLHVLICLGHLGEVVLGPLGGHVHGPEPGQGRQDRGLGLPVEHHLALEVVVDGILLDRVQPLSAPLQRAPLLPLLLGAALLEGQLWGQRGGPVAAVQPLDPGQPVRELRQLLVETLHIVDVDPLHLAAHAVQARLDQPGREGFLELK